MASTTTNVDYYAAGFDSAGRRVCSLICDFNPNSSKNADKITALLNKVKATSDDIAVAEIITADYFNEYLNGKVRGSDGKPTEYIPPEPTAEEKAASKQASLDAEYTAAGLTPVSWNFTTMPSEEWKNGLGTALTLYAAGSGSWDDVVSAFVDNWATEKALSE